MREILEEPNRNVRAKPIEYSVDSNGCWNCLDRYETDGYPQIRRNNKQTSAHRYSYTIHKGEIPKGMVVRHTCDNPKCINPEHLILGTPADNMKDKVERGRHTHGEGVHTSKLTEETVKEIKELLRTTELSYAAIGRMYGVTYHSISGIARGTTWKHL